MLQKLEKLCRRRSKFALLLPDGILQLNLTKKHSPRWAGFCIWAIKTDASFTSDFRPRPPLHSAEKVWGCVCWNIRWTKIETCDAELARKVSKMNWTPLVTFGGLFRTTFWRFFKDDFLNEKKRFFEKGRVASTRASLLKVRGRFGGSRERPESAKSAPREVKKSDLKDKQKI